MWYIPQVTGANSELSRRLNSIKIASGSNSLEDGIKIASGSNSLEDGIKIASGSNSQEDGQDRRSCRRNAFSRNDPR